MGFDSHWIRLVMTCVRTPTFSVLVNGTQTDSFKPTRGLRQGDPLPPYLFILCAETLSAAIHKATELDLADPIRVSRSGPPLSHLVFSDKTIIFIRANQKSCRTIKQILDLDHMESGQKVNLSKSVANLSTGVPNRKKEVLKKLLGITKTSPMQSYLGISPLTRRPSRNEFKATVSRVENRLQGWKAQLLTFAGRLTLIKSVTAGISNHRMSSFKIPLSTVDHLESLQRDFLWSNGNKGKIYAVNWQTVCQPLDEGGLGIRSLYLT